MARTWPRPHDDSDGEIMPLSGSAVFIPKSWYDPSDDRVPLHSIEETWAEREDVRGIFVDRDGVTHIRQDYGG